MKIIRRIFIIYNFKLRNLKTSFLFKWRYKSQNVETMEILSKADILITSDNIRNMKRSISPKGINTVPKPINRKKVATATLSITSQPEVEISISKIEEEAIQPVQAKIVVVNSADQFTLLPKRPQLYERLHKVENIIILG